MSPFAFENRKFENIWIATMRKVFFVLFCVLTSLFAFSSCGLNDLFDKFPQLYSHAHIYGDEWNFDAEKHWHAAICEHNDEITDLAPHDYNGVDGACDVCGYGRVYERIIDALSTEGTPTTLSIGKFQYLLSKLNIEGTYEVCWTENITVKVNGVQIENGAKIYFKSAETETLIYMYSNDKFNKTDFRITLKRDFASDLASVNATSGTLGSVVVGGKIFSNRDHVWGDSLNNLPTMLADMPYLITDIANGADLTVTHDGWIYVLTPVSGNFSQLKTMEAAGFETIEVLSADTVSTTISGKIALMGKKVAENDMFACPGTWAVVFVKLETEDVGENPADNALLAPDVVIDPASNLEEHPEYAEYLDGNRIWQGMASIAKDDVSGRLWATWYSGGVGEGPYNFIVVYTSDDDGATWIGPVLVVDPPYENVRAFDPNLWTDPNGRVWLIWSQSYNRIDGRFGVWAMYTDNPQLENPVWSKPSRLANGVAICDPIILEKPIGELPVGTWILPTAIWNRNVASGMEVENHPNIYVSFDNGESWEYYSSVHTTESARNYDENMVVQRSDGSIAMYIRTEAGIEVSVSLDGMVWTSSAYADITETSSRFWIGKLEDGNLIAVYNAQGRGYLTAALSYDDGETWEHKLLIYSPYAIYPDVHIDTDGNIYIISCENPYTNMKINMAKITVADIVEGKIVTEGSYLRIVINDNTGTDG